MEEYLCNCCDHAYLFMKKYGEPYPETIEQECEECKQVTTHKRNWSNRGITVSISTGFNGITYHPSPLTPDKKKAGKEYRKTYEILREQY